MEQFWQFLVITDLKATERPKNTASIRTYLTSVREVKPAMANNVNIQKFLHIFDGIHPNRKILIFEKFMDGLTE